MATRTETARLLSLAAYHIEEAERLNRAHDTESAVAALVAALHHIVQAIPPGVTMLDDDLYAVFPEGDPATGRLRGVLHTAGYRTRAQLAAAPDVRLLAIRNFGKRGLRQLRERVPYAP
jgi:DNA-directed RNA polymerase alpha subunit